MTQNTKSDPANNKAMQFAVNNIYAKDVSYEASKSTPQIFNKDWKPKLDFDLQTNFVNVGTDLYEVIVHLTVTVNVTVTSEENNKNKKTKEEEVLQAFIVDIKQAGVFIAKNFPDDQLRQILATTAPSILYPYARELVSSMVSRGGFPQLLLPPMNFDALYQKHLEQQAAQSNDEAATKH